VEGDVALIREVQGIVPGGERVVGAFIGVRGPRPGSEVLVLLPYPVLLVITDNHLLAVGASVLVFVTIQVLRTFATVARTERSVLVMDTGRRRRVRQGSLIERLPATAIEVDRHGTGSTKVDVGGRRYWVMGGQHDEARRLAQLPAPPTR
jgi:hypothetical protein